MAETFLKGFMVTPKPLKYVGQHKNSLF